MSTDSPSTTDRLAEAPRHEFTIRAAYNRSVLMCDCGWNASASSGLDARPQLEAAHAAHKAASVPETATERIAEIRAALTDLRKVENGVTGVKGRYAWGFSGVSQNINMHSDLRWLLDYTDRLRARLDTAEGRVLIEQGQTTRYAKAVKGLEAWRDNWKGLIDTHMKRCTGCDACDFEDGDDV